MAATERARAVEVLRTTSAGGGGEGSEQGLTSVAQFIRHTSCDSCGSSDANAEYSDGSSYCFSCGIPGGPKRPGFVGKEEKHYNLPDDLSHDFDEHVFNFVKPTDISYEELLKNGYSYSKRFKYLLREVRGTTVGLRGYDIRNLQSVLPGAKQAPKSLFFGSKEFAEATISAAPLSGKQGPTQLGSGTHQTHPVFEEQSSQSTQVGHSPSLLVCCEDSLSSIKIARVADSCALFGTKCSPNKLARITKGYERVVIWLDSDRWGDAVGLADSVRCLGIYGEAVFTKDDPKYHSEDSIRELLRL